MTSVKHVLLFLFLFPAFVCVTSAQSIISDDFSDPGLNTSLWELEDPQGGATVTMTGTQVNISIPGGIEHNAWEGGNTATRLLQPSGDTDFEVEAKFETDFNINNTNYGLMIKESDTRYLRFDIYRSGNLKKIFVAYLDGSTSGILVNSNVTVSAPIWLQVDRAGDDWTCSYSLDGANWTVAASFTQALSVSEIGPFVGNSGGSPPAFSVLVDYFFNTDYPVVPEDGVIDVDPPVISNVNVVESATGATITWITDEPATSRIDYGLTSGYTDSVEDVTLKTEHSQSITGLSQGTTYHFQISSSDGSANLATTADDNFTTTVDNMAPVISNIIATLSGNSAVITWTTDELATGRVDYGLTASYTDVEEDGVLKTDHSIVISNLSSDTQYHYLVSSTDEADNLSSSTDLTFTTDAVTTIISDDFSDPGLNTSLWELEDPQGGATVTMTGTQVNISIPGGIEHNAWEGGNTATRLLQPSGDTDFEVEAKFETDFNINNTNYGLMIKESDTRYLRFDIYRSGNLKKIFVAYLDGSTSGILVNSNVTVSAPIWLQVDRAGDDWTCSYSLDGANWTVAASFTQALSVSEIGPFVGNSGGSPPAFSVLVDYFFNTDYPVVPEDGVIDVDPPVISNVNVVESATGATITWITDEPATSRIDYGLTSGYTDNVEDVTLKTEHSQSITGLSQGTTYHFQINSTDGSANVSTTSDDTFATLVDFDGPNLVVWHGNTQKVGHLGMPQDDFNLMGNIADASGIASLVYTLNGSEPKVLSIGDGHDGFGDGRRLGRNGDFNADILIEDLVVGENTVILRGTDNIGNQTTETITINRLTGASTMPYDINWNAVLDPQDAGQYIDGRWAHTSQGLRILEKGYDRLFLMGDREWVDYEVKVPITIHNIDDETGPYSGSPGVGVIMRFAGHVVGGHRNFPDAQPKWGYQPFGAIGWLRGFGPIMNKQFYRGDSDGNSNYGSISITSDNTYWITMRAETLPDIGNEGVTEYSWKIWEDGQAEPSTWDWQVVQQSEHALRNGGPALIAHHIDATFGDIIITSAADSLDVTPPVISNISVDPSGTSALISWATDEYSFSEVDYGLTASYSDVENDAVLKTNHSIQLTNLTSNTNYHYQITSTDPSGNTISSTDLTFTTDLIHEVISDDFSADILNTDLWEFEDPQGGAFVTMTGTEASITVPGGVTHDPWKTGNFATRLVQSISDMDFEIELKVESALQTDQSYGILVKESDSRYLRFDIYNNGGTNMFAAYVDGGSSNIKANTGVAVSSPVWLKINRIGNQWIYSYSFDGSDWVEATTFSQAITVSEVGPYVGNFGSTPEHTAIFDYFFNTNSPISPEDDIDSPVISGPASPVLEENQTVVGNYTNNEGGSWSLSGVDGAMFAIMGGELTFLTAPDFELPGDANGDNVYEIVVQATDGALNVGSLDVAVAVTDLDDTAPIVSGEETPTVEENQTVVGNYTNNEGGSWSLSGVDGAMFAITGGELTFLTAPDFELPGDANGDNVYEIVVQATDGALNVGSLDVAVAVTDLDDTAPIVSGEETPTVEENQMMVSNYMNDEGGSWSLGGLDGAMFAITTGGELTFLTAPDFELPGDANGDNVYEIVVQATDGALNVGSLDVAVAVTDLDDTAPIVSGEETPTVEENQTLIGLYSFNEIVSFDLVGDDADLFLFTEGILSMKISPDFENPTDADQDNKYQLVIEAFDESNNYGYLNVTVTVIDIDEQKPLVTGAGKQIIKEDQTFIGNYTSNEPVTWEVAGIDFSLFTISEEGVLSFIMPPDFENPLDHDANNLYEIILVAKDDASNIAILPVEIRIQNVNERILLIKGPERLLVEENNTWTGGSYEVNEAGTWNISGEDSNLFVLEDGHLFFRTETDFEVPSDQNGDNVHKIELGFTDTFSKTVFLEVSVTITDIDEVPPVINDIIVTQDDTMTSIKWLTDEGARSKVVYGETSDYTEAKEDNRLIKNHQVDLENIRSGITYHYQIICEDMNGNKSYSGDMKFTTLDALGIDLSVDSGIAISSAYPNPFTSETRVSIQTDKSTGIKIEIYDMMGTRVDILFNGELKPSVKHEFMFVNEDLPSGIYFIQIESKEFVKRIKVLLHD